MNTPARKNQGTLLLCTLLLCTTAFVFSVAGNALHVLALVAGGMLGSHLLREPLEKTTRTVVYACTMVAVVGTLGNEVLPVSPEKFFPLPAHLLCPALLYAAVALTYFEAHAGNLCTIVSFALLAMMMAGNRSESMANNEALLASQQLVHGFRNVYAVGVAALLAVMLVLLRRVEGRVERPAAGGRSWRLWRWGLFAAALLFVGGGVVGLTAAARLYEHVIQNAFMSLLDQYMNRHFSWVIFNKDVDLWRTVPFSANQNRAIVLRTAARECPGYLRARAYAAYGGGHWKVTGEGHNMPSQVPGGHLAYVVFNRIPTQDGQRSAGPPGALPSASEVRESTAGEPANVLIAANFRSDVLLASGDAESFRVVAKELREDIDGTLYPEEWDRRSSYGYRFTKGGAYDGPPPADPHFTRYTTVPRELKPYLDEVLRELDPLWAADRKPTAARIDALCHFLEERWQYALGISRRGNRDPIVQFLLEDRRGHCELFATAAVLLLRAQGIPARYVTGFVCAEQHPSGNYWISRLSDAHAWAEAYLPEEGRWVLVEATPPNGRPDTRSAFNSFTAFIDQIVFRLQQFFTFLKRGQAADLIVRASGNAWNAMVAFAWHPGRGPLLLLLVTGILAVLYQRRKRSTTAPGTAERVALQRQWQRLEACLRAHGLRRQPAWTLRELAGHIRHQRQLRGARRFIRLIAAYEKLRYRTAPPSPEEIRGFTDTVTAALRTLRG